MVDSKAKTIGIPSYFFSAPWDPIVVRRGDALGLGVLADRFADAVAPDFSNRIRDGRWVTILAWCLVQSQQVFRASGGKAVTTRVQQSERYAWLRPLELLWVARTVTLLETDDWKRRSLAGQRRVVPWCEKRTAVRFGMSPEQFRAYRQTGTYGGYRLAFRKWPGMTLNGDGWTPGPVARRLAEWMDISLKSAQLQLGDELSTRSAKGGRGKEDKWWIGHWKDFDQSGKYAEENTLPRPRDELKNILPEADLLKPVIFGNDSHGQRRLKMVLAIKKSSATSHLELCKHLSAVFNDEPVIAQLYRFSRLADAGMAAMDLIAETLRDKPYISLKEVVQHKNAVSVCKELKAAALAWGKVSGFQIRHIEKADNFAAAVTSENPFECLQSLLRHHETNGGGLRWFVLRNGRVEPRTTPTRTASRYGFRFWSLCRLATQCGVIKTMPIAALRDEASELDEDANGQ
jgi:hypothetical protein